MMEMALLNEGLTVSPRGAVKLKGKGAVPLVEITSLDRVDKKEEMVTA
jgi:hypothetical protein